MLDLISMWTKPKMIAFMALTAILYFALIYPFQKFSIFTGQADYLRVGTCIPLAFGFLFGPAAAWGTAIGNVIYDVSTPGGLTLVSAFGFVANFLMAYLPYMIWSKITTKKPDLRSAKKVALYMGLTVLSCAVVGIIIGWGLYWRFNLPFGHTSFAIAWTDALWAILVGSVLLAVLYKPISARKLLYTDLLNIQLQPKLTKMRLTAISIFVVSALVCFVVGTFLNLSLLVLLPFAIVPVAAAILACK
jgi:energy-coupling factor transport system substrate-specific component